MNDSLKLAALFVWVLGAIYIKEDAKEKIKHHPVVSYEYSANSQAHLGTDSVAAFSGQARN